MSKAKTHKGLKKRVKVTGRRKVKVSRCAFTGHLLSSRSSKRRRRLRRGRTLCEADRRRVLEALNA